MLMVTSLRVRPRETLVTKRAINGTLLLFFNIDLASYEAATIVDAHKPLVDAICNNDPQAASYHAEEHISTFKEVGDKFREQNT